MNISNFFTSVKGIATALISLFPEVIAAVQQAETALGPGNGSAKLSLVMGVLQAAYAAVQGAEVEFSALVPALTSTIAAIVSTFNTIKSFSHAGTPATAPTTAAA